MTAVLILYDDPDGSRNSWLMPWANHGEIVWGGMGREKWWATLVVDAKTDFNEIVWGGLGRENVEYFVSSLFLRTAFIWQN